MSDAEECEVCGYTFSWWEDPQECANCHALICSNCISDRDLCPACDAEED